MESIIFRVIFYVIVALIIYSVVHAVVSAFNPKYKTKSRYFLDRVVEIYTMQTFGKFDKFLNDKFPLLLERWGETVVRAIAKLVAIAVTIFLIFHEFPELIDNMNFVLLILIWFMYALLVFWFDYRKAKSKPTSESVNETNMKIDTLSTNVDGLSTKFDELITKIDELITEMRESRGKNNGK